MDSKPLPFKPESIESMKARYPKCLEKIWIFDGTMNNDRPGLHREYVFDFESGIRLLISRTAFPHGTDDHLSASWEWNPPDSLDKMYHQVKEAFQSIGGKGRIAFLGWSSKAIPHFIIERTH